MTRVNKRNVAFLSALLMVLAMALAACGDSTATTAPAAATTAPAAAATTAPAMAATTAPAMAATTAPVAATTAPAMAMAKVTGTLTVWEAYGSGGTSEGDAFKAGLAMLKKDNPDAKITVLDVPF